MELRVLMVVGYQSPLDISATLADAVYEIAHRTGIDVTVTSERMNDPAGRRELAGQHLIHVIGTPTPAMLELARGGLPLVVTPVRRPRRTRPLQRRPPTDVRWLVHGRGNAAALVNDGVAPSSHVLPLPVLPHLGVHAAEWAQLRARSRAELGLSPGQHVVVGYGPSSERLCRALGKVARSPRHDIVPVWIVPGSCEPAWYDAAQRGLPREPHVVGQAAGLRLLPAMDLLVAGGSAFAARSPAVDAAAAGIPVLSTPSDVASDYVDLAEGGSLLVSPDAAQLVSIVDDALYETERGRASRLRPPTAQDGDTVVATLERCYARALHRPLSSTTTLLRSVRP
jgi:hypothetical protein